VGILKQLYISIGVLAWFVGFGLSWLYAIEQYRWFLGLSLGWFPSAIIAVLGAVVWPLAVLFLVAG